MEGDATGDEVRFERAVLGAALRDKTGTALAPIVQGLRDTDFYSPENRALFKYLAEATDDTVEVPLVALALKASGDFPGDPYQYLAATIADATTIAALPRYIKEVIGFAKARAMAEHGRLMISGSATARGDADSVNAAIAESLHHLEELSTRAATNPWEHIKEFTAGVGNSEAVTVSVKTGLADLDKKLDGGLRPKQVVIIAARPAQGKTTLAMNIALDAAARQKVPGLFISLEMSRDELALRMLSAQAGVSMTAIRRGDLTSAERSRLDTARAVVDAGPLWIVDDSEPTLSAMRSVIRDAHRRLDIKYVVVDYLQLLSGDDPRTPRQEVVASFSRAMKALARQLGIAIIVVAQLNRNPEARGDGMPAVSDLRESGQLEQDADIVLLIHQPAQGDPTHGRVGEADIIVGKHRNGATGTITTIFQGHYARFTSYAPDVDHGPSGPGVASPAPTATTSPAPSASVWMGGAVT